LGFEATERKAHTGLLYRLAKKIANKKSPPTLEGFLKRKVRYSRINITENNTDYK